MEKIFCEELEKPELNEETLAHYGVLGMKWGVRKNPAKAYAKATYKLDKLKKRAGIKAAKRVQLAGKKATKANLKLAKASKKYLKALNKPLINKSKLSDLYLNKEKAQAKAAQANTKFDKAASQSSKATRKQIKWERAIDKTFDKELKRRTKSKEKQSDLTKLSYNDYINKYKKSKGTESSKNKNNHKMWDDMTPQEQEKQIKKDLANEDKYFAKREAELRRKYPPGSNPVYKKKKK